MRISQAVTTQISRNAQLRGAEYYASGAVRRVEQVDGIIHARVEGSATYDVWLEPSRGAIGVACTCPHFSDHLQPCKHIWATILAAESRGLPLLAPGSPAQHIRIQPVEITSSSVDDGLDEHEDELLYDEDGDPLPPSHFELKTPVARTPPRPTRAPPPAPPRWLQILNTINSAATLPHQPNAALVRPRGQLIFVIDVDASRLSATVTLQTMVRERKTNGDWRKPRPARVTSADVAALPLENEERQILERLFGARPAWSSYGDYGELTTFRLRGALLADIIPLLCESGRCFVHEVPSRPASANERGTAATSRSDTFFALSWDHGAPWTFALTIHRRDGAREYVVSGALRRDGEEMPVSAPLLIADGLLVTTSHVARVNDGGAWPWLKALREVGELTVPLEGREPLVDTLLLSPSLTADIPDELRVIVEDVPPRPMLRLTAGAGRRDRFEAETLVDYGGTRVIPEVPGGVIRSRDGSQLFRRDASAERRFLDRLHALGFRLEWSFAINRQVLQVSSRQVPRIVTTLLAENWHVEAAGVVYRQPSNATLQVSSGIDWFDLHGSVEYDGTRVALPTLLAAIDRGEAFVALGDGSMGLLPEEWLKKQRLVAALGTTEGDRLRFKPSQAALLDVLLSAQPEATHDEGFATARRELQAFDGIRAADPPPTFSGTLRGYQREGLGWLRFLRQFGLGGCLADDMGLGKTVMVLALIATSRAQVSADGARRPWLVVAPRSLVFNWTQEAARFTPDLAVLDYTGSGRDTLRHLFDDHDLVLTTYGTLRRDIAVLSSIMFDGVVLDESQAIKNAASASAKAVRLLRGTQRLALSGTPIENHLGELWSLFDFLNPGLLGTHSRFERNSTARAFDDEAVATLARGLRPFILRRTKTQVAPELPERTEQTMYCELEAPQRALYDELRAHYRTALLDRVNGTGLGGAKLQVLEALLRLRQAACHPGLIDASRQSDASAKLDVLLPHLAEAVDEGHKTLVFSQFTSLLALVRHRLDADGVAYEYLDGRTRDRQARVDRFQQDPSCRLFLISLKAGGVGLNLTAAEYVFVLDPWWNPAVEAQAIDRAHRIGQQRRVFAYRLIARDTVEERVLELQQRKKALADSILAGDGGLIRDLKREDLELLLS